MPVITFADLVSVFFGGVVTTLVLLAIAAWSWLRR